MDVISYWSLGDAPVFETKVICQASYETVVDIELSSLGTKEGDPVLLLALQIHTSCSHDCLDDTFTIDEVIFKTMSCTERPL